MLDFNSRSYKLEFDNKLRLYEFTKEFLRRGGRMGEYKEMIVKHSVNTSPRNMRGLFINRGSLVEMNCIQDPIYQLEPECPLANPPQSFPSSRIVSRCAQIKLPDNSLEFRMVCNKASYIKEWLKKPYRRADDKVPGQIRLFSDAKKMELLKLEYEQERKRRKLDVEKGRYNDSIKSDVENILDISDSRCLKTSEKLKLENMKEEIKDETLKTILCPYFDSVEGKSLVNSEQVLRNKFASEVVASMVKMSESIDEEDVNESFRKKMNEQIKITTLKIMKSFDSLEQHKENGTNFFSLE